MAVTPSMSRLLMASRKQALRGQARSIRPERSRRLLRPNWQFFLSSQRSIVRRFQYLDHRQVRFELGIDEPVFRLDISMVFRNVIEQCL